MSIRDIIWTGDDYTPIDADTLDGKDSSEFLDASHVSGLAEDSLKLGGISASSYVTVDNISPLVNGKIDKTAIVNNLTTGGETNVLSAQQGVELNSAIGQNTSDLNAHKADSAKEFAKTFNVKGYGAIGDGVADDTVAINNAITAMGTKPGTLYFPNGIYKISQPITLGITGMRMVGESLNGTYIITSNPVGIDMVRISASHVEITKILFRPLYATDICVRVYGAMVNINNNRFLSPVNNQGTAIILTDIDPVSSSFVAGAYTHTISQNYFGASGYAFAQVIDTSGTTGGQNANCIIRNIFWGDSCIRMNYGGGNNIAFNIFQSSTGTYGTPAGTAIDCLNNTSDIISNNYIERYKYATLMRAGSYNIHAIYNHYDNCTNKFYSLSSSDYTLIDIDNNVIAENGWVVETTSANKIISYAGVKVQKLGHDYTENKKDVTTYSVINVNANGTAITPTTSFHRLAGNGATRSDCTLSTVGAKEGQRLTLIGLTWGVIIIPSTTVQFANNSTSVTFGNAPGNILVMELIFSLSEGKWLEVSRSVV